MWRRIAATTLLDIKEHCTNEIAKKFLATYAPATTLLDIKEHCTSQTQARERITRHATTLLDIKEHCTSG